MLKFGLVSTVAGLFLGLFGWMGFGDDVKIKAEQKGLKLSSLILILPPVFVSPLMSNNKFE